MTSLLRPAPPYTGACNGMGPRRRQDRDVLISESLGCVFVHIQKTGGVSVERALRELDPDAQVRLTPEKRGRHASALVIREQMDPDLWASAFRFGFVRNPWSRLVSWYHHCTQKPRNRFHRDVCEKCPEFRDFIVRDDYFGWRRTRRNQVDYLSDTDGRLLVEFVGRLERLGPDFSEICRRLRERQIERGLRKGPDDQGTARSLPAGGYELPRANASRHAGHRAYYDDELREIVGDRFARDVEAFEYAF